MWPRTNLGMIYKVLSRAVGERSDPRAVLALAQLAVDLLVDEQVRRLADELAPAQRAIRLALQPVVALTQRARLPLAASALFRRALVVGGLKCAQPRLETLLLASSLSKCRVGDALLVHVSSPNTWIREHAPTRRR